MLNYIFPWCFRHSIVVRTWLNRSLKFWQESLSLWIELVKLLNIILRRNWKVVPLRIVPVETIRVVAISSVGLIILVQVYFSPLYIRSIVLTTVVTGLHIFIREEILVLTFIITHLFVFKGTLGLTFNLRRSCWFLEVLRIFVFNGLRIAFDLFWSSPDIFYWLDWIPSFIFLNFI